MKTPEEIITIMLENDAFSKWLHVNIDAIGKGFCKLSAKIKPEMLNGFGIAHGGITYSLSDSALAFASNSYGFQCVSIETAISHLRPARESDILYVDCTEVHRGRSIAIYTVNIKNQNGEDISHFKGTVHISEREW